MSVNSNSHPLFSAAANGVVNNDVQPIRYDSIKQEHFDINEVYSGGATAGRFIVKVNDIVNDRFTGSYWVVSVNDVGIPTLEKWPPANSGDETINYVDEFIGRYRTQATYGIYIDTTVYPYRLVVDGGLMVGGQTFTHCKIFKGADVTDRGVCISQWVVDGEKVGDSFPLEVVATDKLSNDTLKAVTPGWTNYKIEAGEIVSAAFYGPDERVYKVVPLLTFESAVVRGNGVGNDLIEGISLSSPFLNRDNRDELNLPLNLTVESIDKFGVIHYADGRPSVELPIDGEKFELLGMDTMASVRPGYAGEVTLVYKLGKDEATNRSVSGKLNALESSYKVVVGSDVKQYNVSLFVVPTWDDTLYRYVLRYYLYSLDRMIAKEVTEHVYNADSSQETFDGRNYSEAQYLNMAVNLQDVFPGYPKFKYVQAFSIRLNGPYPSTKIPFTLGYINDGKFPRYGSEGVLEIHLEPVQYYMTISRGFEHEWEFLDAMYYSLAPMHDNSIETVPPKPTHFRISDHNGGVLGTYSVRDWNTSLHMTYEYSDLNTLHIEWLIVNGNVESKLATSSVRTVQIGVPNNPVITRQPELEVSARVGESYRLNFTAEGEGPLTYSWHWMTEDGSQNGSDPSDNKTSIVKVAKATDEGLRWYAEVTNEVGVKVTTTVSKVKLLS